MPVAALMTDVIDAEYLDGEVVAVIFGRNIALNTLADVLKGEDTSPGA